MRRAPLVAALAAALLAGAPARAQDNGIGGFFSHLFGGGQPQPPPPKPAEVSPAPHPAHKPRKKAVATTHEPGAPIAPATPPASASQFVYVLGDSLAIAAADGMAADLAARPDIGVIDRARDASGLVRDDYYDWTKATRELVAPKEPAAKDAAAKDKDGKDAKDKEAKPAPDKPAKVDFVVVMLGINDMQPLKDGKDFVDPLTDRWKAAYAQRIEAMLAPLKAAHVPVAWVGLPPMRSDKFNAEIVALNQMFKDNAERDGAKFIDIYDDFANQSGGFDAFGPNMEGQRVKLRGPDGIHLSAAGGLKLAHVLDAEVLAALGGAAPASGDIAALPPDIGKAADDINEQIRREMAAPGAPLGGAEAARPAAAPRPDAGAIASLAARPVSPGAALVSPASAQASEAARALRLGEPAPAEPGRADDFSR